MFGGLDRNRVFAGKWLVALVVLTAGCSLFGGKKQYDDDDDDDDSGNGGQRATGGTTFLAGRGGTKSAGGSSNGGSVSSGGDGANGGSLSSGGDGANGGSLSSGGDGVNGGSLNGGSSNGGSVSSGGDGANGGSLSSGGDGAGGSTGGDIGTGGSTGGTDGGSGGKGGTGGTGGSSGSAGTAGAPTCGSSYETHAGGYVTSPGSSGCWHGFAYTATDDLGTTIAPADFSDCTDDCAICATGTVVMDVGYAGWAGLGVTLNQADEDGSPTDTIIPTGTGLSVSFQNLGTSALRVQIQNDTTQWCAILSGTSGTVTIPYSSFNTACWDASTGYDYDGEAITGVQLVVPGDGDVDEDFDVCLAGVKDG